MKFKLILIILLIFIEQELNSQIPSGTYQQTCDSIWVSRTGILHARCKTGRYNGHVAMHRRTQLHNSWDCAGFIENQSGDLVCNKP